MFLMFLMWFLHSLPSVTMLRYHPPFLFVIDRPVQNCTSHLSDLYNLWLWGIGGIYCTGFWISSIHSSLEFFSLLLSTGDEMDGYFPQYSENLMSWFQNGLTPWVVCSMVLKNSLSLSEQPEVLINLCWRYPTELNKGNCLGPPHCPHLLQCLQRKRFNWTLDW